MSHEEPALYYKPPPSAPPSYTQNVEETQFSGPYVPIQSVPGGQIIITTILPVGPEPTHTICSHCHTEIDTATKLQPGMVAYLSGILLAVFGCWMGCCLIPCCVEKCMDVHHSCPRCKAYLGRYQR